MFGYTRKAQYHETDKMGIIHHSNYIKWMEEARIALLEELGMGFAGIEEGGVVSPVVSVGVDYKHPVYFGDEVEISVAVTGFTGIKLELSYSFFNRTRNSVCALGTSKHCFVRGDRIISLKKELPALYEAVCSYMDSCKSGSGSAQ